MVTRNDVARAAGVSSAVVSYVLNDGPRPVSAGARERVLAAIDQLGYRRNSIARSMRTRKTNSIGFVLPEIVLAYFSEMTQRITEIAHAKGLSVVVATSGGDLEVEREHLIDLASRQVDGIILMSVDPDQELEWVESLDTPVLLVDRPTVAVQGTIAAVDHLVDSGCRSIARLRTSADSPLTRRRDVGWERALDAHGIARSDAAVVGAGPSDAEGFDAAQALLAAPGRPQGLIIDSPLHVMPLLRACADAQVDVPSDLAVVGLEFGRAAEYTVPRLTSVDSPLGRIAAQAVEALSTAAADDRLLTLDGSDFTLTVRESSPSA